MLHLWQEVEKALLFALLFLLLQPSDVKATHPSIQHSDATGTVTNLYEFLRLTSISLLPQRVVPWSEYKHWFVQMEGTNPEG